MCSLAQQVAADGGGLSRRRRGHVGDAALVLTLALNGLSLSPLPLFLSLFLFRPALNGSRRADYLIARHQYDATRRR